jgi:predicted dinucleotide-binding enzyme
VTTAIIGVGNIGGALARHLVRGGEPVVLAAKNESKAAALASELGTLASSASVPEAVKGADVVVLAVWFDAMKQVLGGYADLLDGKVVADPSNPIGFGADGTPVRTLPADQSQGSLVAAMLPAGAHYVKAFGNLDAGSFASNANREPRHAAVLYATDDDRAAMTIERLITVSGFDPVKVGGMENVSLIEIPGGRLAGRLLDADEAKAALASA